MEKLQRKSKYRELYTEKEYLKNLTANLISRFGDSLDAVALAWMIYQLTGSAALSATTMGINTLVSVLMQPLTPSIVINWDRKKLLVITDIIRGVIISLAAAGFLLELLAPWMLMCSVGLISFVESFRQPAGIAILPDILSKDKYTLGSALSASSSSIAELSGVAVAGVIIGVIGIAGALIIDAMTFFVSAAILSTLKLPAKEKIETDSQFRLFLSNTADGFKYIAKNKLSLCIMISACMINMLLVPFSALQSAYVSESVKLGVEAMSLMGVMLSLGMIAGSAVFPKLLVKFSRFWVFMSGLLGVSLFYFATGLVPFIASVDLKWIGLGLSLFGIGVFVAFSNVAVQSAFMEKTDTAYLSRISGIMGAACLGAMPIGSFIVAGIATSVPVVWIYMGTAAVAFLFSVSLLFVKPLREL